MPFHFAESAASAALGKCAGGPDGSAAFASYAFYGEEPRDPTLVGRIAAPAESEVGRGGARRSQDVVAQLGRDRREEFEIDLGVGSREAGWCGHSSD
jgi:hypothetical protein